MKFWIVSSKILGYFWLVLAGLIIFVGIVGVWMDEGFDAVQELLSPFNLVNWFVTFFTLAPGIGLLMLSDKLQNEQQEVS